ncbi:MAG: two-component system response regulator [Acidobacteria bacterium]|nr:MAG: two-component system response regulator [Acidobacteriota bacterium]
MSTTPNELIQPAAPPVQAAPAPTRATVLLAEDDRSARRYFEVILQRAGYTVIAAADGVEAMKAALSSSVDAVVTDAVMPHLGGHELCRFFRRHPKLARLPVVLLSGADKSPDAAESADAYLSKPVRPEELTSCLARLLAGAI